MTYLKDYLSPVYAGLIPDFIELRIPEEKFTKCMSCQFCQNPTQPRSLTKCCDYHPKIPNYMVGAILSDDSEIFQEGKMRIIKKIQNGAGITPNGIIQPRAYKENFKRIRSKAIHSRDSTDWENIKCPFYEQGNCTIWKYRTELCSTFFCHPASGKAGKDFWKSFLSFFRSVENKLAVFALQQMDYDSELIELQFPNSFNFNLDSIHGEVNWVKYDRIWNKWIGKEQEFYISTYQIIQKLSSLDVRQLLDNEELKQVEEFKDFATNNIQNVIPDLLVLNDQKRIIKNENDEFIIGGTNIILKLSELDILKLKLFDGKTPTYDVIMQSALWRSFFSESIPKLIHHGILLKAS
jgi:hypothetical protein